MIKMEIHSTQAVIRSQEPLTVGLTGAKVHFAFGKPWENLGKTAVFRQGEKTVAVAEVGTEATIPWEVLTRPGMPVQIGVYGRDSAGAIVIPTVWATTQPVRPGTDPEADPSTEPTPGLWEQMQGQLGGLRQQLDGQKTAVKVTVTQEADGSYKSDPSYENLVELHNAGNVLYCQYGTLVLSLTAVSKLFFSFGCIQGENVHTVLIGGKSVTVTATPLASGGSGGGNGITPHIGTNGNWFIGETDTGMPSRGETGAQGPQGEKGEPGNAGVYVGSGEMPEGCCIQIDPNGETPAFVQTVNGIHPDEYGNVEIPGGTGSGTSYTLPTASPNTLGGVKPIAKSDDMTQSVGVDETGGLWTVPGSGGSGGGNASICNFTITAEQAVNVIPVELPSTFDKFYALNFFIEFPGGLTEPLNLYTHRNGKDAANYGILTVGTVFCCLSFSGYRDNRINYGFASVSAGGNYPKIPNQNGSLSPNVNSITFYSKEETVNFPVGTRIDVWGVYKQ